MTLLDNTQLVQILRTKKYELIEMGTKRDYVYNLRSNICKILAIKFSYQNLK